MPYNNLPQSDKPFACLRMVCRWFLPLTPVVVVLASCISLHAGEEIPSLSLKSFLGISNGTAHVFLGESSPGEKSADLNHAIFLGKNFALNGSLDSIEKKCFDKSESCPEECYFAGKYDLAKPHPEDNSQAIALIGAHDVENVKMITDFKTQSPEKLNGWILEKSMTPLIDHSNTYGENSRTFDFTFNNALTMKTIHGDREYSRTVSNDKWVVKSYSDFKILESNFGINEEAYLFYKGRLLVATWGDEAGGKIYLHSQAEINGKKFYLVEVTGKSQSGLGLIHVESTNPKINFNWSEADRLCHNLPL